MTDPASQHVAEMMSVPLEQLLTSLGRGIGEAQAALDRHSIEIQRLIDTDPVLGQYGLSATWYQIPSTQLTLKVAVALEEPPPPAPGLAAVPGPVTLGRPLPRLWAQPVNARYQNRFGFEATASSTVSLTVVPVPPPSAVAAAQPTHDADDVLAAVTDRLVKDADGNATGRVSVNFNPGTLTWYVLQTQESGTGTELLKMLQVVDATLAVVSEEPAG